NTSVVEESQGILLAKALITAGIHVIAHDPMASGPAQAVLGDAAQFAPSASEAIAWADMVIITTPWPEYAAISPDWTANGRTRFILDCWRQLRTERFNGRCKIVQLGHQETISAAVKRVAAE